MVQRIFTEEYAPMASDMWQNVSDALYLIDSKCNIFTTGFLSVIILYFQDSIINWALQQPSGSKKLWPLFGYFGVQLYNDWNRLYSIYSTNFGSHFDAHSMGMLFGRFTNAFVNFISLYLLATATGASILA